MTNIADILKEKLKLSQENPQALKLHYKNQSKEDTKKYNAAIQSFQKRLNVDLRRSNHKEIPFMGVRMKMYAMNEISDLRWCWQVCAKYATTKDKQGNRNTFSKCWFGMFGNK